MVQAQRIAAVPGWGMSIIAGIGAGIVAALVTLGLEFVTGAKLPPHVPTAWSAFAGGVLGGLLYAWLSRLVDRSTTWLWVITLVLATIDSAFIIFLPLPAGPSPVALPIVGLIVPLRQLAALVGIGHLGDRHFPSMYLAADTLLHYATAVAASLVAPALAKRMG